MASKRRAFGRVTAMRSGRYQADYPDGEGGRVLAPHTFVSKAAAGTWLAQEQADRSRGTWVDPRAGKVTLRTYAARWMREWHGAETTRETYQQLLDCHVLPALGDMELAKITLPVVKTWHSELYGRQPKMAPKAYRRLAAIMKSAVEDELIPKSPCRITGASKEVAAERPTITLDEMDALVEAADEHLRAFILLAAYCAMRRAEVRGLRRKHLVIASEDKAVVVIEETRPVTMSGREVVKDTKSGRVRTVAIPAVAVAGIRHHLDTFVGPFPDSLVFTGQDGERFTPGKGERFPIRTLYKQFDRARRAIGRPDVTLHDLRHSGLSWAGAEGATLAELRYRADHADMRMVGHYQHSDARADAALADRISARKRAAGDR